MTAVQEKLLLTERGQRWLSKFDLEDREAAARLVRALTLVSHSAFLRDLSRRVLETANSYDLPVALFAAREMKPENLPVFLEKLNAADQTSTVDAVASGSDLGSEARVAATIRSLCSAHPGRLLNHPNVAQMRASRCKAIIIVDDLVGSGKRVREYLAALWDCRSIRSWWSRGNIEFLVVSYAVTDEGAKSVSKLKYAPKLVYNRICPTLRSLPWSQDRKTTISELCTKYGAKLAAKRFILGFQGSAALLVFEHGCPNNVPAILWARSKNGEDWEPLFPEKTVLPLESSAFPHEIVRRDPISLLVDIGQERLAARLQKAPPISHETILILAYAAKGVKTSGALSFATGLSEEDCKRLIQLCVEWGFLTFRFRLTSAGAAELEAAQRAARSKDVAPIGTDNYYPTMLRRAT
jgi:hypothetical protein